MLFLADPVRAATTGALTRSGPRRADVRSRACAGEKLLSPITSEGDTFFVRHHADATDTEVLIIALFIVLLESSAEDTAEWAAGLAPLAAQAADEQAGWATAAAPAGYYDPFQRVVDGKWHKETCEAVIKAVDGWEGRGARKDVKVDHLKAYHSGLRKHPDSGGLGGQPPRKRPLLRFKTWSATRVADLIHRRGPVLRATLGLPPAAAALPSAPSMIEENAALSAAIKQKSAAYTALERELAICRAERADFAHKLHKAKKRAERKRADARKFKEAQQRGYSEAQKAARAAQLATRKRNFDAAVERASYVRVVMLTKKLERANKRLDDAGLAHAAALKVKTTQVATARKRARAVEGDAVKLPGLQLEVKELKLRVEELRAEDESESEDDEPSPRPGCSPIVGLLPRRDEQGLRSFERHIEQGGEARAPPSASFCHSNASTTAGGDSGGATPPAAGAGREGMRAGPRRVFSQ